MLKKIAIIGFCLFNVALFIQIGIEVAAVTPEQAMLEGMTQRIYASISHIDYIMAILWGVILFTALTAKKEYFLRAAWLYLGFYLCDIHFGHYMAMETNDTTWTMGALILVAIQSGFLYWAEKQINAANFVS
jgi:hypothetical protein